MNTLKFKTEWDLEYLSPKECSQIVGNGNGLLWAVYIWISDNWSDIKSGFSDGTDATL